MGGRARRGCASGGAHRSSVRRDQAAADSSTSMGTPVPTQGRRKQATQASSSRQSCAGFAHGLSWSSTPRPTESCAARNPSACLCVTRPGGGGGVGIDVGVCVCVYAGVCVSLVWIPAMTMPSSSAGSTPQRQQCGPKRDANTAESRCGFPSGGRKPPGEGAGQDGTGCVGARARVRARTYRRRAGAPQCGRPCGRGRRPTCR